MKERQSNIELLRIISMLFILIVHFDGAALGLPYIMCKIELTNSGSVAKEIIESFSIIGVNCFVLISGYFGIRVSLKGTIKYCAMCLFYSVGTYLAYSIFQPNSYNNLGLLHSFQIFSHTDLWFVPAYMGLYLLCPFLNIFINSFSKRNLTLLLILLLFINVCLGWGLGSYINSHGYNVMQMVLLYFIGRYIKIVDASSFVSLSSATFGYIIFTASIFVSTFYFNSFMAFAYNSPFVLCSSILFFLIFTKLEFKSRLINWSAGSAFAVYLMHKSPQIWLEIKGLVIYLNHNLHPFLFFVVSSLIIILIFIVCIIIDKFTFEPLFKYLYPNTKR